jgi:hypothetical protein
LTAPDKAVDPCQRPAVRQALARIAEGGYAEAFAHVALLIAGTDEPIPLSLLTTAQELIKASVASLRSVVWLSLETTC